MPYVSDQTVIQRYLTTQDEKKAAKAVLTNAIMSLPGGLLFFVLGVALFVFYKANPGLVHPAIDNDWIFPWFVMQQLPAGVSGLIVAGVFAAAMSSLDSSMNSSAAAILTDFIRRFKSGIGQRRNLMLARILTVAFGALGTGTALLMSRYDIKSLQDTLSAFVGLFIGGLGGLFLLGVLSRRAHGRGALVGLIASAAALYYVTNHTDLHFFLYGEVGLFSCMIVGYLASLIIPDAPDSKGRLKTISEFEQE